MIHTKKVLLWLAIAGTTPLSAGSAPAPEHQTFLQTVAFKAANIKKNLAIKIKSLRENPTAKRAFAVAQQPVTIAGAAALTVAAVYLSWKKKPCPEQKTPTPDRPISPVVQEPQPSANETSGDEHPVVNPTPTPDPFGTTVLHTEKPTGQAPKQANTFLDVEGPNDTASWDHVQNKLTKKTKKRGRIPSSFLPKKPAPKIDQKAPSTTPENTPFTG